MDKVLNDMLAEAARTRETGSPRGAAAIYGRALKRDARSYRAWVGLAVSYADMGQPAKAEEAARRALNLEPGIAHAWQILAELRLDAGDAAGARALAVQAARLSPGSHIPDYVTARVKLRAGDRAGARRALEAALAKEPAFTPAHLELIGLAAEAASAAGLLAAAGRAASACPAAELQPLLGALRQPLLAGPAAGWALDAAAGLHSRLGRELAAKGASFPPGFSWDLATRLAENGRLKDAEKALGAFLAGLAPGAADSVETFRARCCLGRYAEAFAEAGRLLRAGRIGLVYLWSPWFSNRHVPAAYWRRQADLLRKAQLPPAMADWRRFYLARLAELGRAPGDPAPAKAPSGFSGRHAWMNFYSAWEELAAGRARRSLPGFKAVAAALPKDALACCKYGEALVCAGRRAEGFRKFDQALSLPDWNAESRGWKGELLLMTGDYAGAASLLAGLGSTFSEGWLGAALYKLGRLKDAERALRAALSRNDPLDLETRVWLAELCRVTGRRAEGRRLLDGVLAKAPDYSFALAGRALLLLDLGRGKEAAADYARVDRALLEAACGRAAAPGAAAMAARLERLLERSLGNRRPEKYFRYIAFPELAA